MGLGKPGSERRRSSRFLGAPSRQAVAWRALLTFPSVPSCGAAERSISISQAKRGISAASVAFGCTSIVIRTENIRNKQTRLPQRTTSRSHRPRRIDTQTRLPLSRSLTRQFAFLSCTRRVATGRNGEDGRSLFCRFLTATATHRYAWRLTRSRRVRLLSTVFCTEGGRDCLPRAFPLSLPHDQPR